MLKIGNKQIDTNIFLAPLAGCSDLAFRLVAREYGAKFCFFEMVDSHSIFYHRKKTKALLRSTDADKPIAGQLLGVDPVIMLEAAHRMMEIADITFLDINCACPVKKVIKKKSGSYLLKDITALTKVVNKLASNLPIPVTVKLRVGFDKLDPEEIAETAKKCEGAGAAAIFVHGRTREQGYKGGICHASIKAIKDAVKIPVIGGGNIFSGSSAKKMFTETGCDGIFVARGSFGNPWIFREIENYLRDGSAPAPVTPEERKEALKKHIAYVEMYKESPPPYRVGYMRKVVMWYVKGFPMAAKIRGTVCKITDYNEMLNIVDRIDFK